MMNKADVIAYIVLVVIAAIVLVTIIAAVGIGNYIADKILVHKRR